MTKKLIIAEKPSVAADIARALGGFTKKDDYFENDEFVLSSAIGHLLGAAGSVEAIFSTLAIRDNVAPPTLNLENPSVETPLDLVPLTAQERRIDVALSNSFGFGGTNASLIFVGPPN